MRLEKFRTYRILLLLVLLVHAASSFSQSPSKNYVQTKTFLDDAGTTFLRHIDYYDELGVVAETVDVGVNTSQTPVVTRTEYNTQLKPFYQWAPLPATGLDYIDHVSDKAQNTYNSTLAYTTNDYDDFQELSSSWKPAMPGRNILPQLRAVSYLQAKYRNTPSMPVAISAMTGHIRMAY